MDVSSLTKFLEDDEARLIAPLLQEFSLKSGEIVSRPDEMTSGVFFVAQGRLAIQVPTGFTNKMQVVALLGAGSMVGEGGVVENSKHRATVLAIEDTTLLSLTRIQFNVIEREYPVIAIKILKRLLSVTHHRLLENSERLAHVL